MTVMLILGSWEWCRLIGISEIIGQGVYIAAAIALALLSELLPSIVIYLLAALWWLGALYLVLTYPESEDKWRDNIVLKALIGFAILVPTWLGVIELQADPEGPRKMMFVFVLVWAADIGAYFSGKRFGKRKLAPKVSPGKSIEGVIGGLLVSLVLGLALKNFVGLEGISWLSAILLFSFVVLFSVLGDLTESLFKRVKGVKDSSQLLPGHGGILDRIDSLTAAVPMYFAVLFLLS
jgi:phosphatidate cytidylyltransferase